jgi:hypothetical protein
MSFVLLEILKITKNRSHVSFKILIFGTSRNFLCVSIVNVEIISALTYNKVGQMLL